MSLINHYKQPLKWRFNETSAAATTITVWTPISGRRLILEGADLTNASGTSTTVALYFGPAGALRGPTRIGVYNLLSTTSVQLKFGGLEATADATLLAITGAGGNVGVTAYGFEIE